MWRLGVVLCGLLVFVITTTDYELALALLEFYGAIGTAVFAFSCLCEWVVMLDSAGRQLDKWEDAMWWLPWAKGP